MPKKFDITYRKAEAEGRDRLLVYLRDGQGKEYTLVKEQDGVYDFLQLQEGLFDAPVEYGFAIDEDRYFIQRVESFLGEENCPWEKKMGQIKLLPQPEVRSISPRWMAFALITGWQIARWRRENRYCGACGKPMSPREGERAMICPDCGHVVYPKISPAVIVGVVDGEKLLLTKYAPGEHNYRRYALIAGFCEVGETLEDTVRREVQEEVGLQVEDVVYFKNQPWSFSDSLLVGFFARLKGDNRVSLQDGELSEGTWFNREDIQVNPDTAALTTEMIRFFAEGGDPWKR